MVFIKRGERISLYFT